jgi:hypothetical protein
MAVRPYILDVSGQSIPVQVPAGADPMVLTFELSADLSLVSGRGLHSSIFQHNLSRF